jgi:GWxTD domain-containing protein
MMDEEKKIYKALPDSVSKKEFIEEFWKIRDPDPSTEENENKIEFQRRIAFANEWFGNWKTFVGRSMGKGKEKDRGWKTDRGRVFIILGPPNMVSYGMGWEPMRLYNDNKHSWEVWYYRRYDLMVHFNKIIPDSWRRDHSGEKDKGEPYLVDWDYMLLANTELLYRMEDAKREMISFDYRGDFSKALQVEATYQKGGFTLEIPIGRIIFEDKEGRLHAIFHLKITVYKENRIIDEIEETKTYVFFEQEVLDMEKIVLEVPYSVKEKGNYLFDLVLTDLKSLYRVKYRTIIKKRL